MQEWQRVSMQEASLRALAKLTSFKVFFHIGSSLCPSSLPLHLWLSHPSISINVSAAQAVNNSGLLHLVHVNPRFERMRGEIWYSHNQKTKVDEITITKCIHICCGLQWNSWIQGDYNRMETANPYVPRPDSSVYSFELWWSTLPQ